jgi:glycosyltransferase involved in cell wall biosynthesis
MRICIDATSLLLRSAGVKNHVYHWMRSLKAEAPEHEITAFPMLGEVGALDHERSMLGLWQTLPRIALLHLVNIRFSGLIDSVVNADIFHASNLVRNLPKRPKLTGTIYDMTAMLMPEVHTEGNVRAERSYAERVLKRADGLIAISEASKRDAVRLLGIDAKRITVVYPGIDERFFTATPMKRPKPYVLFVGTIEPRKNIDALLDAWLELPIGIREAHDLLISGPVGWQSKRTLDRIKSGILGVEYLGYVPESTLPSLTAGASVFVYPSLYEGFGFPSAQALAAGVPVITSNVSSLPEVVGDAGILLDPRGSFAMRDAMQRLLLSPSEREEMGRRGKERARRFTWKNSAEQSAEFFARLG